MAQPTTSANKLPKAPALPLPAQELQVTSDVPQDLSPPTNDSKLDPPLNISVTSVAYLSSEKKPNILYCALLINLQLPVANSVLNHASIPFEAKLVPAKGSEDHSGSRFRFPHIFHRSQPRAVPQTTLVVDAPFYFPSTQELVKIGSKNVMRRRAINPQGSISVFRQGASAQGYENTTESTGPKREIMSRVGFKSSSTSRTSIPVQWTFENYSHTLYPAEHTLILIVSCAPKDGPPAFEFDLILLGDFEVKADGNIWPFHLDRVIEIRGNYEPDKVDNMLKAYRDKTPDFCRITLHELTSALREN